MKKLLTTLTVITALSTSAMADNATATIHVSQGNQKIYKEIYGQFAEHLGSCIYGGLWVGENSQIPNINGYRKDVFDALKALQIPVLRWPGGCGGRSEGNEDTRVALAGRMFCRRVSLDGRYRPKRQTPQDAEQQLGRHYRRQLVRNSRVSQPLRNVRMRAVHQRQCWQRLRRGTC